jgi:monoamine oxidase
LAALRQWGALDANYAYKAGVLSSDRRGYERDPGGGLSGEAVPSEPPPFAEILRSRVWLRLALGQIYEFQSTIFQPVGGMDMIARAFVREIGSLIRYNAKVTAIKQDDKHVTVTYVDAGTGGAPMTATANWCLCTIPLWVLAQIDLNVAAPMMNAINAVPYGAAAKIGLQFKRRFWEEDEQIYGGITYTDLPIWQIGYPNTNYGGPGQGRAARRLRVRQPVCLRVHRTATGGPPEEGGRVWCADPSAIRDRVREWHSGRLAPGPLGARLLRQVDRGSAQAALQEPVRHRRANCSRR